MTSGLTATKVQAAGSTLPTCTDPTGQNLPCMMVISTLPPPANAIQCQESSSQILPCSYATQNLSNGQEVMVITVYVPAGFLFSPGILKVIVHETEKKAINKDISVICPPFTFCPPHHTTDFLTGYDLGSQDGSVGVYDLAAACEGKTGAALEHCVIGYKDAYVTTCHNSKFGCGDGPTACPPGESSTDCYVPSVGPPLGPPPCHGPYPPGVTPVYPCPGITSLPISRGGNGEGSTCAAGNCTAGTTPRTGLDCTKSPSDPSCQQQQHHTAAYLQALNSGSPNPYKSGTKDYEHYQAGLDARQQGSEAGTGSTTSSPSGPSTGPSGSGSPPPSSSGGSGSSESGSGGSSTGSSSGSSGGSSGSDGGGGSSGGGSSGSGDSDTSGATTKK
jgi:hypothetical protein